MSKQHPIVAITGSSGAGTSTVRIAMEHVFRRDGINAVVVEGDSFHRYDRAEMQRQVEQANHSGDHDFHSTSATSGRPNASNIAMTVPTTIR